MCKGDGFGRGCNYFYENDNITVSISRMFKNRFKIKGVYCEVEISDKKFEEEVHRLKVEESKKLEKEALERKEKYK
jgi:hypothetical protein